MVRTERLSWFWWFWSSRSLKLTHSERHWDVFKSWMEVSAVIEGVRRGGCMSDFLLRPVNASFQRSEPQRSSFVSRLDRNHWILAVFFIADRVQKQFWLDLWTQCSVEDSDSILFNALNEEFVIKHSVCIWAYEAFTMWVGHYGEVLDVLEVLPYKSFLVSFYLDKVENNIWVDLWFNPDFQIFVAQASDVKS